MLFGEIAYYPKAFGVAGGLIVIFAIITFFYWGKSRETLEGRARLAADFRAIGYLLLIVNSYSLVCSLLGSPFSGLYFPEKVMAEGTLPIAYSQGLKSAYYFAGSFIFFFLASYLEAKENKQKKAM